MNLNYHGHRLPYMLSVLLPPQTPLNDRGNKEQLWKPLQATKGVY